MTRPISRELAAKLYNVYERALGRKLWVMAQFQQSLEPVVHFDEEGRKRFGEELRNVMRILGIESDDELLDFYLDWFQSVHHRRPPGAAWCPSASRMPRTHQ